jgi:hypothetical protein
METACSDAPQGWRLKPASRRAVAALAALTALMLASCAGAPPPEALRNTDRGRQQGQLEGGTSLWVLRFYNEVNPDALPTTLDLSVEGTARAPGGQFVFKPLYNVAGRWVEFVVRLDLPAGEYRVSRLVGVGGSGKMAPQFDISTEQRFTVEPGRANYLGRIEIVNRLRDNAAGLGSGSAVGGRSSKPGSSAEGSPVIELTDKSDLDLASLRARFADLRERRIDNGLTLRAPLQDAATEPTKPASPSSSPSPSSSLKRVPPQGTSRSTENGRYDKRAEEGTVLWVVRFFNEINPEALPGNLALSVEDVAGTHGGQFVFQPLYSVTGRWVEFVVRLDLPAGEYRLSRLFGVAGKGQMAPQFDFSAEQRFAVEAARTHYLGRLEIVNRPRNGEAGVATGSSFGGTLTQLAGFAAGIPMVELFDKGHLDLASLRARFPDLRDRRIDNGVSPRAPLQEAKPLPRSNMPPQMRRAFAEFVASPQPRAFAHDPAGPAFGMASGGQDASARALQECEKRRSQRDLGPDQRVCVLYAVDDALPAISASPAASPAAARTPGPTISH